MFGELVQQWMCVLPRYRMLKRLGSVGGMRGLFSLHERPEELLPLWRSRHLRKLPRLPKMQLGMGLLPLKRAMRLSFVRLLLLKQVRALDMELHMLLRRFFAKHRL